MKKKLFTLKLMTGLVAVGFLASAAAITCPTDSKDLRGWGVFIDTSKITHDNFLQALGAALSPFTEDTSAVLHCVYGKGPFTLYGTLTYLTVLPLKEIKVTPAWKYAGKTWAGPYTWVCDAAHAPEACLP